MTITTEGVCEFLLWFLFWMVMNTILISPFVWFFGAGWDWIAIWMLAGLCGFYFTDLVRWWREEK